MRVITFSSASGNAVSWKCDRLSVIMGTVAVQNAGMFSTDPDLLQSAYQQPSADGVSEKLNIQCGLNYTPIALILEKDQVLYYQSSSTPPSVGQLLIDDL